MTEKRSELDFEALLDRTVKHLHELYKENLEHELALARPWLEERKRRWDAKPWHEKARLKGRAKVQRARAWLASKIVGFDVEGV